MSKVLVFDYTFDASARTVELDGIYQQKTILIINNTTSSQIIYSAFDDSLNISNIQFNYTNYTTTLTLSFDTTAMSDTDQLQIFVDQGATKFEPAETYADPVSKLRVSNPENLIDTDFEYGLQSTKWETLELTNNIPTFFSRSGDAALDVTSIETTSGSSSILVTTATPHELLRGTPIIVKGTQTILADGGFIIKSILSDTEFTYEAKGSISSSGSIYDTYTELFIASIYEGTEFKLTNVAGMTSNEVDPSTLTVNTEYPTKFTPGTKVAVANTFAKSTLDVNTNLVDIDNVINKQQDYVSATATGEGTGVYDNWHLGGVQPFRFRNTRGNGYNKGMWFSEDELSINTSSDYITFPTAHPFNSYDIVYYVGDTTSGNTPISGLAYGNAYIVYYINSTTIRLQYLFSSSSTRRVQIYGPGTSGGVVKSAFIGGYGLTYYNSSYGISGWQLQYSSSWYNQPSYSYARAYEEFRYGTGGTSAAYIWWIPLCNSSNGLVTSTHPLVSSNYYVNSNPVISTPTNGDFGWYVRYYSTSTTYNDYVRMVASGSYQSSSTSYSNDGAFIRWNYNVDGGRSTLYMPNHGLSTYDHVQINAVEGTLPPEITDGGVYRVEKVSDDRIALRESTGSNAAVAFSTAGTSDLEYRFTAILPKTTANSLKVAGNTLLNSDKITYTVPGGGTAIGGLVSGTDYYVANKNTEEDTFQISTTPNALTADSVFIYEGNSSYVNPTTNTLTAFGQTMPFVNGDAVKYTTNASASLPGLSDDTVYWVGSISSLSFKLYYSKADALAGTDEIDIYDYTIANYQTFFTKTNIIDLTSSPTDETHTLEADFVGAADGNYEITSTATDGLSFELSSSSQVQYRTISSIAQNAFNPDLDGFRINDHGLVTGDAVVYTEAGNVNVSGLTSGTTYYAIQKNKDFFQLASSQSNAESGTQITLTEAGNTAPFTGTLSFEPQSMIGEVLASGTISYTGGSRTITGVDTDFTSYFTRGDSIDINIAGTEKHDITNYSTLDYFVIADTSTLTTGEAAYFTTDSLMPPGIDPNYLYFIRVLNGTQFSVYLTRADAVADTNRVQLTGAGTSADVNVWINTGDISSKEIAFVNSQNVLSLAEDLDAESQADIKYLQRTRVLLRPDGFALHRPYDGGVELIPPTNPDSKMIRQTRKYFRYQSGKGIQVSYAVNFSPSTQTDVYSASGTTGTIVTRYPHRLSVGLPITISGATNTADLIGTETISITVRQDPETETNYFAVDGDRVESLTLYEGRTYRFDQSDVSNGSGGFTGQVHPLRFSTTEDGTHGGGVEYTTGVTTGGTPGVDGYTQIVVATDAPTLYTYCENHSGMGFDAPTLVDSDNNRKVLWNGSFTVDTVPDEYTFTITLDGTPSDGNASGITEFYVNSWANSSLRCGLFDNQNGLFFEYDGQILYCCRKSSTQQISGYNQLVFRSGQVLGTNTKYQTQLSEGEDIVIKGQMYRITRIASDTEMYVSPSYRGKSISNAIITKIEVTRVPQSQWNLDTCDGKGYTGFKLDIHKIQMAYMDYSWYGAGKVRFGFKDQHGDVKYVHEFVHGNFKTEAFMRSGNMPARYEIENIGEPTYVPALAHWGTSVIMDGKFDPDKAYIFNASSNNVTLTGADSFTTSARVESLTPYYDYVGRNFVTVGYGLLLASPDSQLASAAAGTVISGAGIPAGATLANPASNQISPYQPYIPSEYVYTSTSFPYGGATRSLLLIDKPPTATSGSNSTYTIGQVGGAVNVTKDVPLISIRLAPSVDTSSPGFLGEREIVNRMQLILNQVAVVSTHAVTVRLIVNGSLSSNAWQRVTNPSLSQLILHDNTDTIEDGQPVYNFEAAGGTGTTDRTPVLTTENLNELATLGNSILGGDGVFPDGPDVLTVVATLNEDPSTVSATNPLIVSGRISWSESQA